MASVKDMRTRIASVKSTQKITKALQMVAAAKLRRAQAAAQNARPYAERMAAVIANLSAGVSGPAAPRLLAGTGSDQRHLIIVATADRGLAGGFNSNIVRAAREKIGRLLAEGKDVKIITMGRKGRDQLRRQYGAHIIETHEVGTKAPAFAQAKPIAETILSQFDGDERRRRHADLQPLQIGRVAGADRQAADPGGCRRRRHQGRLQASTTTSRTRARSWQPCCRRTSPCRF